MSAVRRIDELAPEPKKAEWLDTIIKGTVSPHLTVCRKNRSM